jgi:hypothetical protein
VIRSHRGGLLAVLALAMPALVAACGGQDQSLEASPPYPSAQAGPIAVRAVLLVASPDGKDANVVLTLVNEGSEVDTLQQLTVTRRDQQGGMQVPVNIPVRAGEAVNVGSPGQPSAVIRGIDTTVQPGGFADLELLFANAGETRVTTILQSPTGYFASYAPTALPPPTTTPFPTGSPSGTPTPTGTPS